MLSPHLTADLIGTANRLADAAAAVTLEYFRKRHLASENKDQGVGFDPVTIADREAEAAMRAVLAEERPNDGIFGEEEGKQPGTTGLTWVLDPIDGTRAFISGLPTWGTLIGLDDGETGRIGIIDQPFTGERYLGTNSAAVLTRAGATRPVRTRACSNITKATLMTTAPELFTADERPFFDAISAKARLTRYGTDCYAYAMLASGHIDLVIESGLHAYDIAGPAALVKAAGGTVTNWEGGDCRWGGQTLAAGDPTLHRQVLKILNGG